MYIYIYIHTYIYTYTHRRWPRGVYFAVCGLFVVAQDSLFEQHMLVKNNTDLVNYNEFKQHMKIRITSGGRRPPASSRRPPGPRRGCPRRRRCWGLRMISLSLSLSLSVYTYIYIYIYIHIHVSRAALRLRLSGPPNSFRLRHCS